MDLISRQVLKKYFYKDKRSAYTLEDISEIIEATPISYDVDKVVEQLKEEGYIVDNEVGNRVIEIVKAGGKDE